MIDGARFQTLARRAKLLAGDYGAGYQRGLCWHYHGDKFGTAEEHARWLRLGQGGDHRVELGRGYRDGLAGRDPEPLMGRPPLPEGQRRDSSLSMRTYSDVSDKAKRIGTAAIEALIRDAPEPAQ